MDASPFRFYFASAVTLYTIPVSIIPQDAVKGNEKMRKNVVPRYSSSKQRKHPGRSAQMLSDALQLTLYKDKNFRF